MAEEVYGQPTRMEEIQEKLLMMAEFQDEELIDLNDKDVGKVKIKKKLPGKKIKSIEVLVKVANSN